MKQQSKYTHYRKVGRLLKDGTRDYDNKHGEQIAKLHHSGWTFQQIAIQLNISRQAAHQAYHIFIKSYGLIQHNLLNVDKNNLTRLDVSDRIVI